MKIEIPKVIFDVDMGEYAPELSGRCLQVWVNPPLDLLSEHLAMAARLNPAVVNPHPALSLEGEGEVELLKWYAHVWSQGSAESHWTVDELKEIEEQDPAFLSWMISMTWEARKAHMDRKKKV